MLNENKALVEKVNAAFASGSNEEFLSVCADDAKWTIVGDKVLENKAAIKEFIESMTEGPPHFTVDHMFGDDDWVMCRGSMAMDKQSETPGSYGYCDIYRISDGQIRELITFVVKDKTQS